MAAKAKIASSKTADVDIEDEEMERCDIFTLEVLLLIKEAQQQHGMRHGDHQRYRSYCSRRMRRIRKSLHFTQGDKRRFTPKNVTEATLTDIRYLYLPLFAAERAWGMAMQLKSEANTEPRKRFHSIARLRKSAAHAHELAKLCESSCCDARSKLETQAYESWIRGTLQFELTNWKNAIEFFNNAKTIYEKLASAFTEDLQLIYLQKVEEIAPSIRYCAYNIGDESAITDLKAMRSKYGGNQLTSNIDDLLAQTREKQSSTLSEVTWHGRTIQVKSIEVRAFLLNIQDSERAVEEAEVFDNKMSVYDGLLKDCIDVLQVTRDALHDDQGFKAAQHNQKVEGKISNLHHLYSYLCYIRITKTEERNLLLVDQLTRYLPGKRVSDGHKVTKPQDLVRLYDIILQTLNEIPNLAGVDETHPLRDVVAAKILTYKAYRTFYIAQSYASNKKWPEAIGLFESVLRYTNDAQKQYKKVQTDPDKKTLLGKLSELVKEVNGLKYSCHASSILDVNHISDHAADSSTNLRVPLVERLDAYTDDTSLSNKKPNLVTFPPDFQPIPCRPLFFDLALNNIEFPSLEEKLEQKKSTGLTGMVKGWLWGSKK